MLLAKAPCSACCSSIGGDVGQECGARRVPRACCDSPSASATAGGRRREDGGRERHHARPEIERSSCVTTRAATHAIFRGGCGRHGLHSFEKIAIVIIIIFAFFLWWPRRTVA